MSSSLTILGVLTERALQRVLDRLESKNQLLLWQATEEVIAETEPDILKLAVVTAARQACNGTDSQTDSVIVLHALERVKLTPDAHHTLHDVASALLMASIVFRLVNDEGLIKRIDAHGATLVPFSGAIL